MAHVVVTHDPDVRTVLDMLLHCEDHVVMSVPDGQRALPALELGRYSAVGSSTPRRLQTMASTCYGVRRVTPATTSRATSTSS